MRIIALFSLKILEVRLLLLKREYLIYGNSKQDQFGIVNVSLLMFVLANFW